MRELKAIYGEMMKLKKKAGMMEFIQLSLVFKNAKWEGGEIVGRKNLTRKEME